MDVREFIEKEREHLYLWDFTVCDGKLHLWPFARNYIVYYLHRKSLSKIMSTSFAQKPGSSFVTAKQFLRDAPRRQGSVICRYWRNKGSLHRILLNNPSFAPPRPIAILNDYRLEFYDGKWYSRLFDWMYYTRPELVNVLEYGIATGSPKNRQIPVFYVDLWLALVKLGARFIRISTSDRNKIESFVKILEDIFGNETLPNKINDKLLEVVRMYLFLQRKIPEFIKKFPVRLIIVHGATRSFDWKMALVKICHNYGVITADYQHGISVNIGCDFPSNFLKRGGLKLEYYPDYYLTLGSFWLDKIAVPSEKYSIGLEYPDHLREKSLENSFRPLILIISTLDYGVDRSICETVARVFPDKECVLKLHPNDMVGLKLWQNNPPTRWKVVHPKTSIYTLLPRAHRVIGHTSTALVESLAFGIRPLVYSSPISRELFRNFSFEWFENMEELQAKLLRISDRSVFLDKEETEEIIASDARKRFQNFVYKMQIA